MCWARESGRPCRPTGHRDTGMVGRRALVIDDCDVATEGRRGYRLLYRIRLTPWESTGLPMELVGLAGSGRALELGCGRGKQAIELARRGWQVVGIDFAPEAMAAARERARQAGVSAEFRVGDVTRLAEADVGTGYDLVYDIKCFHGLAPTLRPAYAAGVAAACRSHGDFILFATEPSRRRRRLGLPPGVSADDVRTVFSADFEWVNTKPAPDVPFGEAVYHFRRR